MDPARRRTVSKRLSYHLRHRPDELDLQLDEAGWVKLDRLLEALARRGLRTDRGEVAQVIATSDKPRFELSEDGARIRARYGHSVPVDLGLQPVSAPPAVLYHGTVAAVLDAIAAQGLRSRGRQQVHLSEDVATATQVGARRGRPHR